MFIRPAGSFSLQTSTTAEPLKIPDAEAKCEMIAEVNAVSTYKSTKRGNPQPHPEFDTACRADTMEQRRRGFAHAFVRTAGNGSAAQASDRP